MNPNGDCSFVRGFSNCLLVTNSGLFGGPLEVAQEFLLENHKFSLTLKIETRCDGTLCHSHCVCNVNVSYVQARLSQDSDPE